MAKKKSSKWKKAAKVAALAAAAYGASKLGRGIKNVHETGAITQTPGSKWGPWKGGKTHIPKPYLGPNTGPITLAAKGGRIGKKGGGRTGKQFGGGLGSTARRDMRSGYYPSDMGMRGGTMYKKGGRVKSMGVAKRGGGAAKR
jgi:hypothetical protein